MAVTGETLATHLTRLASLKAAVDFVVREASLQTCNCIKPGASILSELNCEHQVATNSTLKYFDPTCDPSTLKKYLGLWLRIAMYVYRSWFFLSSSKAGAGFKLWTFTSPQRALWQTIYEGTSTPYDDLDEEDR